MKNAFYETRNLFRSYTGYTRPLSYNDWLLVADSDKAAVLYVQFFDEITLAWNKTKSFYALEEDAVSTVLQYLSKNVPILINDPKRFTSAYIYRVAYNCLYCISHDIKRDRERYENETSNIVICGEDVLDLFDTVITHDDEIDVRAARTEFWRVIETMGPETEKVINHILNGESLGKVSKRNKAYEADPLRDVSVTADKMEAVIEELKVKLDRFRNVYHV